MLDMKRSAKLKGRYLFIKMHIYCIGLFVCSHIEVSQSIIIPSFIPSLQERECSYLLLTVVSGFK